MVLDAVEMEEAYNRDLPPTGILGLNAGYMNQYVRYLADRRLDELGFGPHYNVANPAKWMATSNDTPQLVNFFESINTSYEDNARQGGAMSCVGLLSPQQRAALAASSADGPPLSSFTSTPATKAKVRRVRLLARHSRPADLRERCAVVPRPSRRALLARGRIARGRPL